ncbi:MAG: AAA family ATPase, partial [Bacteroidota bacterium]
MLTKLIIRNFKRFDEVEIDLGNPVVFVGPNNSGKTSALQAIALWNIGARRWTEKRRSSKSEERYGVAINRLDLFTLPVPSTELLWRNLHLRKKASPGQKSATENIYIDIVAKGVTEGKELESG